MLVLALTLPDHRVVITTFSEFFQRWSIEVRDKSNIDIREGKYSVLILAR